MKNNDLVIISSLRWLSMPSNPLVSLHLHIKQVFKLSTTANSENEMRKTIVDGNFKTMIWFLVFMTLVIAQTSSLYSQV